MNVESCKEYEICIHFSGISRYKFKKMYFLAWSIFIKFIIVLIYPNGENLIMIKLLQEVTYVDIIWRLSK